MVEMNWLLKLQYSVRIDLNNYAASFFHNRPSAKIHESVEIGPFCLIGPDVEIGEGTKIESHVILKGPTK